MMRKINVLLGIIAFMTTSLVAAQTMQANFVNEEAIWSTTENGQSSTFTVNTDENGIAEIREKYNNLGSSISYQILADKAGSYQITMNFGPETYKVYIYKMLLYMGCDSVKISDKIMSMEDFLQLISA
jgi:hypothetical protein